jgi:hypothetical protein
VILDVALEVVPDDIFSGIEINYPIDLLDSNRIDIFIYAVI